MHVFVMSSQITSYPHNGRPEPVFLPGDPIHIPGGIGLGTFGGKAAKGHILTYILNACYENNNNNNNNNHNHNNHNNNNNNSEYNPAHTHTMGF